MLGRHFVVYLMAPDSPGDKGKFPASFVGVRAEDRGNREVRFTYYGDKHPKSVSLPYNVGEKVVINLEEKRYRDVFFFEDCDGVSVENVAIRRFGGMGVVGQRSGNIKVDGLSVHPHAGERVTLTADIVQIVEVLGPEYVLIREMLGGERKRSLRGDLYGSPVIRTEADPSDIRPLTHRLRAGVTLGHVRDSRFIDTKESGVFPVNIILHGSTPVPCDVFERRIQEVTEPEPVEIEFLRRPEGRLDINVSGGMYVVHDGERHRCRTDRGRKVYHDPKGISRDGILEISHLGRSPKRVMEFDSHKSRGIVTDVPVAVEKRLTRKMENFLAVKAETLELSLKLIKTN